ncbi:MAG TPA: NAD(P)-dependent oxidoreductase [Verrucomicrobiales bacterium]|nr:NAD(P)-dependent oxidoreductase [Verrucomicrobiales bacterium]
MKRIGFIGLGDMGLAMSKNLIKAGFELTGYDLREERLEMLEEAGAKRATNPGAVGVDADAVFIMVMNGKQGEDVVLGEFGLVNTLPKGSTIILTATIEPSEVKSVSKKIHAAGIEMIDSPVSGGVNGSEAGTLTMMAAAKREIFDANQDVMGAVGKKIFHVGEEIGMGQTVKAALQALIATTFAAIFESLVLGAKAGIPGSVMHEVFTNSAVASPILDNCSRMIMDRKFKDTGSRITTIHKDIGISMNMAKQNGVAMFTAAAAQELFQSGIALFPDEDNWSVVKLLEQIAGTEVKW